MYQNYILLFSFLRSLKLHRATFCSSSHKVLCSAHCRVVQAFEFLTTCGLFPVYSADSCEVFVNEGRNGPGIFVLNYGCIFINTKLIGDVWYFSTFQIQIKVQIEASRRATPTLVRFWEPKGDPQTRYLNYVNAFWQIGLYKAFISRWCVLFLPFRFIVSMCVGV